MTKHDWVGKVIKWELRNRLNFDHITKHYMLEPESILENKKFKILWDFEIQTNCVIAVWKPDLEVSNK